MADADAKPRDSGAKSDQKDKKKSKKNKTRELVECLLVAGVLALGIRTFAFQLFKIPTRSMEPTLIGNRDYGDRVVAAMWYNRGGSLLPLKLAKPDRWQVIVFDHYVIDRDSGKEQRTNFIKRLIGLPGERLELRDGDVWIQRPGSPPEIERKPPGVQEQLWTKLCDQDFSNLGHLKPWWRHRGLTAQGGSAVLQAPSASEPASLRWAELDLRDVDGGGRNIDNRFIRLTVREVTCPDRHKFKAAFDTARPVAFCPKCDQPVWGVRNNDAEGRLVCDTLHPSAESDYWTDGLKGCFVPDLRLALDFEYLGGAGELQVVLTGRDEPYRFTLPLGVPDPVGTLSSSRPGVSGSRPMPVAAGGRHHLEVVNVDGAFWAELDGQRIEPCRYQVAGHHGRSDVQLTLSGGAQLRLERIRLWRDIYYTFRAPGGNGSPEIEARKGYTRRHEAFTAYREFGDDKFFGLNEPLGPDQYFFLGDNTLASQDSRAFGPKRERDIVARAIFVGWPPSRFHLVW